MSIDNYPSLYILDNSDTSVSGMTITLQAQECNFVCVTDQVMLTASTDDLVEVTESFEISIDNSILNTFTGLTLPSVVTFEIDDANGNNNFKGNLLEP